MPAFRNRSVFGPLRGVKAFLNLDFGLTRGPVPDRRVLEARLKETRRKLSRAKARLARQQKIVRDKDRRIRSLERSLERASNRASGAASGRGPAGREGGVAPDGVAPGNVVWIFGNGRTGSTWLSRMMGDTEGHTVWFEPCVGELFGSFYYDRARVAQRESKIFILGDRQRETWIGSIRSFVLDGAGDRFPRVGREGYLVVKEPHGSMGAPLLMEALPESRMVLLVRDPRDVVASSLDALREGSWAHELQRDEANTERLAQANERPDDFVKDRAASYLWGVGKAKEAYEAHKGRKTLVRYEDLRANTLEALARIYADLEIDVAPAELVRVVEKYSWESIPEKERGPGRFYRKASPGSWKEELTPGQIETVERITAPLLEELYLA